VEGKKGWWRGRRGGGGEEGVVEGKKGWWRGRRGGVETGDNAQQGASILTT
jgi:hypothetical protein